MRGENIISNSVCPRWLKTAAIILAVYFLQIYILPILWFLKIKPDLLFILAVLLAINLENFTELIILVLFCGLLKDIFSLRLAGFNIIMFGALASLIYFISGYVYKETPWLKFIFLILATLLNYFILTLSLDKFYMVIGLLEAAVNCLFLVWIKALYQFVQPQAPPKVNLHHAHN